MNKVIQMFITGFCILIVAIIINAIAIYLNIPTWYSLIENGFKNISILNIIFLFVIYPLTLGATAYYSVKFLSQK